MKRRTAHDRPNGDSQPKIRSIGNTMDVLAALARSVEPVRVTDLAAELGMHKSAVSRYLTTLKQQGFVQQVDDRGGYVLGLQLVTLGEAARRQNPPYAVAKPHLEQLRLDTGLCTMFGTPGPDYRVTVIQSMPAPRTMFMIPLGTNLSLPTFASARVVLAFAPANAQAAFFETCDRIPGLESARARQRLRAVLPTIAENFYDAQHDPEEIGLSGMAAPVFDVSNSLVGTISVAGPPAIIGEPPRKKWITATRNCARRVSEDLKSTAWDR